jgi:hypothetical protein
MATALKLKRDINKLKAAIRSKATPQSYVPKLKAQLQKAEADYESVKAGKKSAPKASKQVKSTMDKLKAIIKKKKYGAYRAQGVDLKKDADRPALRSGKRISKNGNTYYEYRANRIDVKQPPKRYPKLEDGGMMKKGGMNDGSPNYEGANRKFNDNVLNREWATLLKEYDELTITKDYSPSRSKDKPFILDINDDSYFYESKEDRDFDYETMNKLAKYSKKEDGGMMAGGGYMAKKGKLLDNFSDKIQEGDIVWDSGNKRYGTVLNTYDFKYGEIRLDSDGNQPEENLHKLGSEGDKGTKDKLIEALVAHKRLIVEYPDRYDKVNYEGGGMTPADLQKQIWNLTARIAKLGDIESRAASDEIEMLMKQRKKLQSMALNHGDVVMAQGGELHRSQEEKFKYGGYMAKGGIYDSDNSWVVTFQNQDSGEFEKVSVRANNKKNAIAIAEEESGLNNDWTYYSAEKEMASGGYMAEGGKIKDQYEGREPEDIWNNLSKMQRSHFIFDHASEIEARRGEDKGELKGKEISDAIKKNFDDIDIYIRVTFENHVREGQYKYGGYMAKGGATEHGLKKGDTIWADQFWDNTVIVDNPKTGRAVVNLETGKRKEQGKI